MTSYKSQSGQDKFVLHCTKYKKNGTFLEIGSNDPKNINNSYILEKEYNWRGIMVEYDSKWLESYKMIRPNSYHIIQDATTINYAEELVNANMPTNIDYLQIDLEVSNNSTLQTLIKLDKELFDTYTFGVVTFEHDIYAGNYYNTREISRSIFEKRGYVRVFSDICNESNPFEDWYVHPSLVDMNYIRTFAEPNGSYEYTYIINKLT